MLQVRLVERVKELRADSLADEALVAQEIAKFVGPLGHHRGGRPVPRPPRALAGAVGVAGAVRAEARLPAPGNEPRGQHDRIEGGRARSSRSSSWHSRPSSRRCASRCRMSSDVPGACCSSSPPRPAPARPPSSSVSSQIVPDLSLSRSYTSRATRAGETDGVDYNFITRERFEEMIAEDAVPRVGRRLRQPLRDRRRGHGTRAGRRPGSRARHRRPGRAAGRESCCETVGVFVLPPSFEVLERRLRGRSKDARGRHPAPAGHRAGGGRGVRRIRLRRGERRARSCVDRLRSIVLAERARLRSARHDGGSRSCKSFRKD